MWEKEKKEKKMPMGCATIILILFVLGAVGFFLGTNSDSDKEKESEDITESNDIEGIEVDFTLEENNKDDDKSVILVTIKNTTDKAYTGEATFSIGLQQWNDDIDNLPPRKETTRRFMGSYIKHPDDGIRYSFDGELIDSSYESTVEYGVFNTEVETSFNIQLEEVTKENVIEVVKEMYSLHGDDLLNLRFYDENISLEDGTHVDDFPLATYFGKPDKVINLYLDENEEKIEFDPNK